MKSGHRWRKGEPSANPGGRPSGVRERIRQMTHGGEDILLFLQGLVIGREKATMNVRLDAARELGNRLWGRPVDTTVQIEANSQNAAARLDLPPNILESIAQLASPDPTPITQRGEDSQSSNATATEPEAEPKVA